ncbi:unnamed protein product, partial [marine sediment metagenome]
NVVAFADDLIGWMTTYGYDGIQLNQESFDDWDNYLELASQLRTKIDDLDQGHELSMGIAPWFYYGQRIDDMDGYIDWYFLMSYWDDASDEDDWLENMAPFYINAGIAPEKLHGAFGADKYECDRPQADDTVQKFADKADLIMNLGIAGGLWTVQNLEYYYYDTAFPPDPENPSETLCTSENQNLYANVRLNPNREAMKDELRRLVQNGYPVVAKFVDWYYGDTWGEMMPEDLDFTAYTVILHFNVLLGEDPYPLESRRSPEEIQDLVDYVHGVELDDVNPQNPSDPDPSGDPPIPPVTDYYPVLGKGRIQA